MRRKSPRIIAMMFCLVLAAVPAGADSYGTELPFTAGTGGRASGLGLAATSIIGGPSLQHFNPASLAHSQYKNFEFYRTTFFDSKSMYHTLSYAHPMMNYGTLGLSILRLDVGGIEQRDEYNILGTDDLKNSQSRVLLGYATSLQSFLSAGLNLKIDHQVFGDYNGTGIGLDLGFLATKSFADPWIFETIRGGLTLQNLIEPSVKLDREDVADPMNIALGLSAVAHAGDLGFVSSIDLINPRYSPFRARLGQECSYQGMFYFRAGLDGSTPTFGVGASYRNASVDYAYRDEDLGSNHRISVSFRFGASLDEKRTLARTELEAELDQMITAKMSELETSQVFNILRKADSLFTAGRYEDAQGEYELALLWDSNNENARARIEACRYHADLNRGRSLMTSGKYLEALYYLKQALRRVPGDPDANSLLDECNQRIQADEDRTTMIDGMLKRAIDLYAARRFTEALSGFREILRLAPQNDLAVEYEQKTRVNVENLKRALIVEANGLAAQGDLAAAIAALEKAQVYDPDDAGLAARTESLRKEHRQAAATAGRIGKPVDTSASQPVFTSQRSVDPVVLEPKYKAGMQYFDEGDFDSAIRYFTEIWTVAPGFHNVKELLTKAHLFTGMKMYSEGRYEEAIRAWELALAVDPANTKASRYLRKAREESRKLGSVNNE